MVDSVDLDPQRQVKAKDYARLRRRLMVAELATSGALLVAWVALGWGPALRAWLQARLGPEWLVVAAFGAVFFLSLQAVDLPLSYYSGYVLPRRYDLSTQSLGGWVRDQALGLALAAALGAPLLLGLYWLLHAAGPAWWLWAGGAYLGLTVLLVNLAPVVIMPLFNRYVPLGDEHRELAERLVRLAKQANTRVSGVFRFDMSRRTRAANAALTGLGNTRRIILGDTLLNQFTADEVETVIAHELGHHVHRDIPGGIAVSVALTLVGLGLVGAVLDWASMALGLAGRADVAGLPVLALALSVFGLVTLPLNNAYSRWREVRADDYALRATRKPQAFANAMTRLANQNLAEADPERWVVTLLYSHPPIRDRVAYARRWAQAEGLQG